jgi:hypothetical protein
MEDDGNGNGPILYDPAGAEYAPDLSVSAEAQVMRYTDTFTGKYADPDAYIRNFSGDVEVVDFVITSSEARLIKSEFVVTTAPYCATNVGYALSRAPRFSDVKGFFPGSLQDSLKEALDGQ